MAEEITGFEENSNLYREYRMTVNFIESSGISLEMRYSGTRNQVLLSRSSVHFAPDLRAES